MHSISPLMQSVFTLYVMKDFPNTTFTRYNYRLIIVFVSILSQYCLRPYEEWIRALLQSILTIAAPCSYFSHFTHLFPAYALRTPPP